MKRAALLFLILGLIFVVNRLVVGQRFGRGRERRNRIPEPSAVLQTVKSLKCSFSGGPSLAISSIDVEDGTAEIGGGFRGGENVIVKLAGANLHFLDIALNGALSVVTVFAKETPDGRLQAVYSHTSYLEPAAGGAGPPEIAQYQGQCEAGR